MPFGRYTIGVQWHIVLYGGLWPETPRGRGDFGVEPLPNQNMQSQIAAAVWRIETGIDFAFSQITLGFFGVTPGQAGWPLAKEEFQQVEHARCSFCRPANSIKAY